MEQKALAEVKVVDVMAISSVLDQFDSFNQNLKELTIKYNMADIIYHLKKAIRGETTFFRKRGIYQFYQENKDTIDIINKDSDIFVFLSVNYDDDGTMKPYLDFYYRYLLEHKDEKEQIQALLQRLNELEIKEIAMDKELDFTQEEYRFESWQCRSFLYPIVYLENMEILPNYETDVIRYRSKGSNYKLLIGNERYAYIKNRIFVNDLTFPVESLPQSVRWKSIQNHILKLAESTTKSKKALRNSVDLNVSLQDLDVQISDTCNIFTRIDGVNSKPELVAALTQIKNGIAELYDIKREYDAEITTEHPSLSQQAIKEETKQYIKKRDSMIDID